MDDDGSEGWMGLLRRIRENDPNTTSLDIDEISAIDIDFMLNMTDEDWEQLGRDISNNSYLKNVELYNEALNDRKMSFLFRGLTRSSSIKDMNLYNNGLSVGAVRSMVPFLQNANNLMELDLTDNNFQSEGFNLLFRALRDSPVEELLCQECDIDSIEIDSEDKPKHLKRLYLNCNSINSHGCRELAKLLQGDSTLTTLDLTKNKVDDEGVEILVEALRSNTALTDRFK